MTTAQPNTASPPTPNSSAKQTLKIKILNQQSTLFDGEAEALTTISPAGPFDILPQHIQLITLIKNEIIVHNPDNDQNFSLKSGVLKCQDNKVEIYIIS